MMKYKYYLSLLICLFSFAVFAQEQETPKPQVLINLGWGATESETDFKESMLLAAEMQLIYKTHLVSARSLFINDDDYDNRKLKSYSLMYGYIEDFGHHSIYAATGVSFNQFKTTFESAGTDGPVTNERTYDTWGVPLNAGFNVMLSNRMGLNAQAFYNFNKEDNFIGYYLSFRARIY